MSSTPKKMKSKDLEKLRRTRGMSTAERSLALAEPNKLINLERKMSSFIEVQRTFTCRENELLADLKSSMNGLSQAEAAKRLSENGANELESDVQPSIFVLFLLQFSNIIIILLLAASIASFALGEPVEGIAVIIIILLNAFISVATEKSANDALAALASMSQPTCAVLRDGQVVRVPSREVVVGDVLVLHSGDIVAADARLLSSNDLKVQEAVLTGESTDVSKRVGAAPVAAPAPASHGAITVGGGDKGPAAAAPAASQKKPESLTPRNEVFASTKVTSGEGHALVFATAMKTRVGEIAKMISGAGASGPHDDEEPTFCEQCEHTCAPERLCGLTPRRRTPLQEKTHQLGLIISAAALTACVAVFIIGILRDYRDPEHPDNAPAVQMVLVAVSLAVSAVPEGLPLVQTVVLATGMHRLMNANALIRRLPAVETLGQAQVVCSDKTGTLTEGKMTALRVWIGGRQCRIGGRGDQPVGSFTEMGPGGATVLESSMAMIENGPSGKDAAGPSTSTRRGKKQQAAAAMNQTAIRAMLGAAVYNCTAIANLRQRTDQAAAGGSSSSSSSEAEDGKPMPAEAIGQLGEVLRTKAVAVSGNSTEAAIILAGLKAGVHSPDLRRAMPSLSHERSGREAPDVPFSSARKAMVTIASLGGSKAGGAAARIAVGPDGQLAPVAEEDVKIAMDKSSGGAAGAASGAAAASVAGGKQKGAATPMAAEVQAAFKAISPRAQYVAYIKGAPDRMLPLCSHTLRPDGTVSLVTPADAAAAKEAVSSMSSEALRVLCIAARPLRRVPYSKAEAQAMTGDELYQKTLTEQGAPLVLGGKPHRQQQAAGGDGTEAEGAASGSGSGSNSDNEETDGVILLGLIACMDPEREGVDESVLTAREAGVKTVMITGDYLATAIAIGRNVSILLPGDDPVESAIDCADLRTGAVDDKGNDVYVDAPTMDEITSRVRVFARAQPKDKLMIVESLRRQGHITAMTGDGVNDAPALSAADIGVAMGIAGTEAAKGAADVVLLDDSFPTIIRAIEEGRHILDDIMKFLTYLLGTNMAQVTAILVAVAVGLPIPLKPLSILFLNLAIDGAPAMAMSVEPAEAGIMKRHPRPSDQPVVTSRMWLAISWHSIPLAGFALASFVMGLHWHAGGILADDIQNQTGECEWLNDQQQIDTRDAEICRTTGFRQARTMAFITLVYAEVLRGITVRTGRCCAAVSPLSNPHLLGAMLLSATLATIFLLVPGVQDVFGFEPIAWHAWVLAVGLSLITVASDEIMKACIRDRDRDDERWAGVQGGFGDVLTELRQLRHHVEQLENRLEAQDDTAVGTVQ